MEKSLNPCILNTENGNNNKLLDPVGHNFFFYYAQQYKGIKIFFQQYGLNWYQKTQNLMYISKI
jgi:hypothetical protein